MTAPATSAQGAVRFAANLEANPKLARWLRISAEGFVEIAPGKVELGQGILTALAQIAADELDVRLERVRLAPATTGRSPNEGVTAGSLSVQDSGQAIRAVCAEARAIYLSAASERLGVPVETLGIEDGTISGPGNARTSYWELADDRLLAVDAGRQAIPKPAGARTVTGTSAPRLDVPDKVFGRPRFIHDLVLPGMLHGRVLRPDRPRAKLMALDEEGARALPGVVAVVRDGDFLGVIAESEPVAEAALTRLRASATWEGGETLPDPEGLDDWLHAQPIETSIVATRSSEAAPQVSHSVRRKYSRPFLSHGSIAPSCALALWTEDRLYVWSHAQGVYNLRADLALVFGWPAEAIVVEHVEGAGCYGQNGADDVALDAALLARAAGDRPVRMQWSRADEFARSPIGAAMAVTIEADLDLAGKIVAWRHDVWSNGHVARPGRAATPTLLAASELAQPFERFVATNPPLDRGGGADRNAVPGYDFPAYTVTSHRVLTMPLRTSSLRSLGAFCNVFAIESFVDELAHARGEDPLAFRLQHLRCPRSRAVLEAAAARAGWSSTRAEGRGQGIGFARYKNSGAFCAVIAEVAIEEAVRVTRLIIGVDVGEVINPDGVVNQIEGGAVQATSWSLKEAVRFDRERVLSESWADYPILTFSEVPAVEVEILHRPDEPPLGAGEAAHGPTCAAIANGVFDAIGVRVRDLPITRARIIAAMDDHA